MWRKGFLQGLIIIFILKLSEFLTNFRDKVLNNYSEKSLISVSWSTVYQFLNWGLESSRAHPILQALMNNFHFP